jgi:hypothetical protein
VFGTLAVTISSKVFLHNASFGGRNERHLAFNDGLDQCVCVETNQANELPLQLFQSCSNPSDSKHFIIGAAEKAVPIGCRSSYRRPVNWNDGIDWPSSLQRQSRVERTLNHA